MNKLLRLTTLSLAIASLGIVSVRAQEVTPNPSGSTTPAPTDTPAVPSTPATPNPSVAPPTTAPMQAGVCNATMTSNTSGDSASTYTAGPSSKSSSSEQSNMSNAATTSSMRTSSETAASSESTTTSGQVAIDNKVAGYSTDAPKLLKASSSVAEEYHEIGPSHHIDLYTGINPLCYVSVQPLNDILTESNDSVRVFDKNTRNELDIKVTKLAAGGAKIVFAQPVVPKTTLEIVINGVEYDSQTAPSVVQYSLAGGYVNFNQEIPYGIAQVNRHLY